MRRRGKQQRRVDAAHGAQFNADACADADTLPDRDAASDSDTHPDTDADSASHAHAHAHADTLPDAHWSAELHHLACE